MEREGKPPLAPGGTTPLPNALLDAALPTLKDTELRVLLVVFRQTWGWSAGPGRRRARDWISSGLLRRRTGRCSEAVSGAIDALVRRGLLVVEDAGGRPLATAGERRRYLGRLYFRPGDMWKTPDGHLPEKAKITKEDL